MISLKNISFVPLVFLVFVCFVVAFCFTSPFWVGLLQFLSRKATLPLTGYGSWLWFPLIGASDHQHFLPGCWF